ncbi:MAG TPA: sugar phosphate nucleotidyltransferase [Holophagaceae bacterium]|jgi:MurNAc alpha-1-phosphate uridylyltransferase|nr:sugar phosphate nucleotidyltransferase [Holophagaceae bacterium]
MMALDGFILAAGLGTRMEPLSAALPKPAWTVAGRSLLQWGAEAFRAEGVTGLACNAHLHPDRIHDIAAGIEVFEEPTLLGSAGGLLHARDRVGGALLTWNADSLAARVPFGALRTAHLASGTDLTWLLIPHPGGPWTKVWLDGEGRVLRGDETGEGPYLFTGAACWSPFALDLLPEGASEVRELLPRLRHHRGFVTEAFPWHEVGTPDALIAAASELAPEQEGRLAGCYLHPSSAPGPGAESRLRRCILGPHATPHPAMHDQDAFWFGENGNQVRLGLIGAR